MDDLETAEAYRREAEFYKEKAEENIRYKCLYLRRGGEPSPPDAGTGG